MNITGQMIWDALNLLADRDEEGTWFQDFHFPHYKVDGTVDCQVLANCLNEIIEKNK